MQSLIHALSLIQKKRLTDKIMETAPEKYSNIISDNVFKNIGRTAYNLIRDFIKAA